MDSEKAARLANEGLISIIASYLAEREIALEAEGIEKTLQVNSGVPQGSVLDHILWNVLYNELLDMKLPDGVKTVGFADAIGLVVVAKGEQNLMDVAYTSILRVTTWMTRKGLQITPEETEAVLLTTKRKMGHIEFAVEGHKIPTCHEAKHLGVWLDTKCTFEAHIKHVVTKGGKNYRCSLWSIAQLRWSRSIQKKTDRQCHKLSVIRGANLVQGGKEQKIMCRTNKGSSCTLSTLRKMAGQVEKWLICIVNKKADSRSPKMS